MADAAAAFRRSTSRADHKDGLAKAWQLSRWQGVGAGTDEQLGPGLEFAETWSGDIGQTVHGNAADRPVAKGMWVSRLRPAGGGLNNSANDAVGSTRSILWGENAADVLAVRMVWAGDPIVRVAEPDCGNMGRRSSARPRLSVLTPPIPPPPAEGRGPRIRTSETARLWMKGNNRYQREHGPARSAVSDSGGAPAPAVTPVRPPRLPPISAKATARRFRMARGPCRRTGYLAKSEEFPTPSGELAGPASGSHSEHPDSCRTEDHQD